MNNYNWLGMLMLEYIICKVKAVVSVVSSTREKAVNRNNCKLGDLAHRWIFQPFHITQL